MKRLKIEPNQANLIRRWLRALLVVCLVLFSLVSVKIPLTVFAFAGGALAIGLGFGMQTMLKNFVSGLIILFERPFRVGDVLDVGGQTGNGHQHRPARLRAAIVGRNGNPHPEQLLLENNVTNWTYSNRKVRFCRHRGRGLRLGPAAGHPIAERGGASGMGWWRKSPSRRCCSPSSATAR